MSNVVAFALMLTIFFIHKFEHATWRVYLYASVRTTIAVNDFSTTNLLDTFHHTVNNFSFHFYHQLFQVLYKLRLATEFRNLLW